MMPQHLLLLVPMAAAYTLNVQPSFVGRSASTRLTSTLVDVGTSAFDPAFDSVSRYQDASNFFKNLHLEEQLEEPTMTLREAEAQHGMPWKTSIDKNVADDELLYMKFWEWQHSFMEENLTDLKYEACTNGETDFSFNVNEKKKARIVNICASSKEYRKIRMTYYDAGDNTQVFNAVWYPDPEYNLPVLGIDILAFNRKKYLAIVDFQPLHEDESDHDATYEHLLEPLKEKYDSLKGRMSSKFYDETQFFSQQMLFARFDDENVVHDDLFPAFKSYVKTHVDLVKSTERNPSQKEFVMERQEAYDEYSAERDPATGLFAAMFGAEWANDFVHDFLFSMSEKPDVSAIPTAFVGGPPSGRKP
eukprot:CAMPEP_0113640988 /NCGR_PEP_ID=MMETSP0017_2-20120614/21516_1 /TAXON_ID=2856 /ORGANISM="Cylindrotheca closterium" /LENGTH=360 /DNA_ID=CAMNT_0000552305 /DNA_START=30 /DNA_END=1112 /DNA_ORIENTATION=- /assembly_acc=CAM_ASM_000147